MTDADWPGPPGPPRATFPGLSAGGRRLAERRPSADTRHGDHEPAGGLCDHFRPVWGFLAGQSWLG